MAADVSSTRLYLGNLPRDGTQSYVLDFVNTLEDLLPATNRLAFGGRPLLGAVAHWKPGHCSCGNITDPPSSYSLRDVFALYGH